MGKFILTESEKNQIRGMYGLIKEQKYMQNYPGTLLDFCGYRAIEQFEETMGDQNGKSMGDDYFEGQISNYEQKISSNIENNITTTVFKGFPPKLRMQIWSFMFNSTDASDGTVKWIAGLAQAMGLNNTGLSDQDFRIKVSNKTSKEYASTINEIKNFKGNWSSVYNNYLKVLDQQYISTAVNNKKQGSYDNSWKYRPTKLNEFYDNCGSSIQNKEQKTQNQNNQQSKDKKITIKGSSLNELRDNLKSQTKGLSVDTDSAVLDVNNFTVTFNLGEEKIQNFSLIWSNVSKEELNSVYQKVSKSNPTVEFLGDVEELTQKEGTFYCLLIVIR